jgi:hypothetical protein
MILDSSGQAVRQIIDPKAGTIADFYHRAALAAAALCDDATRPVAELHVLTRIAAESALCRDLLTQRQRGKHSNNETFGYLFDGTLSAGDARDALLFLAAEHEKSAEKLTMATAAEQSERAAGRAAALRLWAGLVGDVAPSRSDVRPAEKAAAICSMLAHNLILVIARGAPDLIQPLGWISAEAVIAASAGVAPRLSLL